MIDKNTLLDFKTWFNKYVSEFNLPDQNYQSNIQLKKEHARRVCGEIITVGKSLNLNEGELYFAEALALFHDVGRFEQYTHYGTFADFKSEDHAQLGIRILEENSVLKSLAPSVRDLMKRVISLHNKAEVNPDEEKDCLFYAQLLRDADKLDIFRVVTEYYSNKDFVKNTSIELDLPDTSHISQEVLDDLLSKRIVLSNHIHSLNDFKLLQIGWIYDLNFPRTFQLVKEKQYINKIIDVLPKSKELEKVFSVVFDFLEEKCQAGKKTAS